MAQEFDTTYTPAFIMQLQGPHDQSALLPDTIAQPDETDEFITPDWLYTSSIYTGKDSSTIELSYTNDSGSSKDVHFRLSFYKDPFMNLLLYSVFSQTEQKRWYIPPASLNDREAFEFAPVPLKLTGLTVDDEESKSIYYAPEVLPLEQYSVQNHQDIGNVNEMQFVCGVAYYVRAEVYVSGQFQLINNFIYKVNCVPNRAEFREYENLDAQNWLCSGQGRCDTRVSKTQNHATSPNIFASGYNDIIYVAWNDYRRRSTTSSDYNNSSIEPDYVNDDEMYMPIVSYGWWRASDDFYHTSGQLSYDWHIAVEGSYAVTSALQPSLATDIYYNVFAILSNSKNGVPYLSFYNSNVVMEQDPYLPSKINMFKDNVSLSSGTYPNIRVAEEDLIGGVKLTSDSPLAMVDSSIIRLDITGVSGVYAVRLKNDADQAWSQWINIGPHFASNIINPDDKPAINDGLYTVNTGDFNDNELFNANKIDDDRFICPWILSPGSGLKTVWCQVLTFSGVSQISLLNILANIDEFQYKISLSNAALVDATAATSDLVSTTQTVTDPYGDVEKTVVEDDIETVSSTTNETDSEGNDIQTIIVSQNNVVNTAVSQLVNADNEIIYNGKYVVKNGLVYVKIQFINFDKVKRHFDLMSRYTKFNAKLDLSAETIEEKVSDNISFNIFQGGLKIFTGLSFGLESEAERTTGIFIGTFKLPDTDDVFIRDGEAILTINMPNMSTLIYPSSYEDPYDRYNNINMMLDSTTNYAQASTENRVDNYVDLKKSSTSNKVIDVQYFKELYNSDDPKYNFGNISYWNTNKR